MSVGITSLKFMSKFPSTVEGLKEVWFISKPLIAFFEFESDADARAAATRVFKQVRETKSWGDHLAKKEADDKGALEVYPFFNGPKQFEHCCGYQPLVENNIGTPLTTAQELIFRICEVMGSGEKGKVKETSIYEIQQPEEVRFYSKTFF